MQVGALPARLEGGVTAGGQVGGALEGNGVGGALEGKCSCGRSFGGHVRMWWTFEGKVLVWAGLWRASAGVGVALEQNCGCVWDDAQAGTGSSSLLCQGLCQVELIL